MPDRCGRLPVSFSLSCPAVAGGFRVILIFAEPAVAGLLPILLAVHRATVADAFSILIRFDRAAVAGAFQIWIGRRVRRCGGVSTLCVAGVVSLPHRRRRNIVVPAVADQRRLLSPRLPPNRALECLFLVADREVWRMFRRYGEGQTLGRPTKVSVDARYGFLIRGLFVADQASWDWRWSAVVDGMKLVPPDLTFKAAPTDVTPRTCGFVHIYMATNGVFLLFRVCCRGETSCRC